MHRYFLRRKVLERNIRSSANGRTLSGSPPARAHESARCDVSGCHSESCTTTGFKSECGKEHRLCCLLFSKLGKWLQFHCSWWLLSRAYSSQVPSLGFLSHLEQLDYSCHVPSTCRHWPSYTPIHSKPVSLVSYSLESTALPLLPLSLILSTLRLTCPPLFSSLFTVFLSICHHRVTFRLVCLGVSVFTHPLFFHGMHTLLVQETVWEAWAPELADARPEMAPGGEPMGGG